jgi:hypothetical protein
MLHDIREKIKKIETPENSFLADVFLMCPIKEIDQGIWQIDYFDGEKIISFQAGEAKQQPEDSFKDPAKGIEELKIDDVKVDFKEALTKAKEALSKHPDDASKLIAILQVLAGNTIWNISFITTNFFLHNTKIDALTGEVIKEKYDSLLSFKAQ